MLWDSEERETANAEWSPGSNTRVLKIRYPEPSITGRRSCFRHDDCDKADARSLDAIGRYDWHVGD